MPKQYFITIEFLDGARVIVETKEISINHPVRFNGWKIYLMSYDDKTLSEDGSPTVMFRMLFKHDPGEFVALAGIIMTIAGTICMCIISPGITAIRKKRGSTDNKEVRNA
jgi:hypothetical protein